MVRGSPAGARIGRTGRGAAASVRRLLGPAALAALALGPGTAVGTAAAGSAGAVTPTVASPTSAPGTPPGIACATTPDSPRDGEFVSASAASGGVRATLTGTAVTSEGLPAFRAAMLRISGGGVAPSDQSVPAPQTAGDVQLESLADSQMSNPIRPLCVVALNGGAVPTVLVGFYTGGAHCCTVIRAYSESGGRWTSLDRAIGDPGVQVREVGGSPAIVTADDSFSYEFTDYAASGDPVEVLTVDHGTFRNVTRQFPAIVTADAAHWWAAYEKYPQEGLGLLAAWAADRCELGQHAQVVATLGSLQARHRLGANRTAAQSAPFWPSGSGYVAALTSFLAQHGYCPPG
jgi:hypothetical protein